MYNTTNIYIMYSFQSNFMAYHLVKKLKNCILAGILGSIILIPSNVSADSIFKGLRGPTNWQLDERIIYSKNEKNVEAITNNLILKYWNGDELGGWGFISCPYKYISSSEGSDNGVSDISIGLGPRGRIDKFNWFLYGALAFPTGNFENKLGNGRFDKKIGYFVTYLTTNKRFEIDGSLEYNFTGENKKEINPPNELASGLVTGGKLSNRVRFVSGLTGLIKEDEDYSLGLRLATRYIVSKSLHSELVYDKVIDSKNIPKSSSISLFFRLNF